MNIDIARMRRVFLERHGPRDWDAAERAIHRLEERWNSCADPTILDLLPPPDSHARLILLVTLIAADQEHRWRSGEEKNLESYLAAWPELDGNTIALVELVEAECRTRARLARMPSLEELQCRFPSLWRLIDLDRMRTEAEDDSGDTSSASIPPLSSLLTESIGPLSPREDAAVHLSEGSRVGRYEIGRLLGAGGMGEVYLARDPELDREIAIKVPHCRLMSAKETVDRFLEEARSVSRLRHPAIVPVFDVGRLADGRPFVAMEYIEGGSLLDLLKSARPGPAQTAEMIACIAEAAHHAHRHGFVHRDLKPANILLDADRLPYIVDFGLALREDAQRRYAGERSGTLGYMSPEQVRGDAHRLDGRADIWALGVVLYESLTGRLPFTGKNIDELCDEILHRDPKPLRQIDDTIPGQLERICLKCLAKQPTERYSTAWDLARDLRRANGANRAKWSPLMAAALTLLVLSVGIALVWHEWPTSPSSRTAPLPDARLPAGEPGSRTAQTAAATERLVDSFRILHYRDRADKSELAGELGVASFACRDKDSVQISVSFREPAHCYLVAFNTNGQEQLCYPLDRKKPPQPVRELEFPAVATDAFYLTDGPGQQAFAVLASPEPLPAYADWRAELGDLPWKATEPGGFCEFDGQRVFTRNSRGEVGKLKGVDTFELLCQFLRNRTRSASLNVIGFPVLPE